MPYRIFKEKKFLTILAFAIVLKVSLFGFGTLMVPESQVQDDSYSYKETARTLATSAMFARKNKAGILAPEVFRTPGYPVFLVIFHHLLRIPPAGILFIQLILTIFVGIITYWIAYQINPKIALLSAAIVLFDPPIAIYSGMFLTETLFALMITGFLFFFVLYLRDRKFLNLMLSALLLALATYVRPISYFLAIPLAGFIVYAHRSFGFKEVLKHSVIFLIFVYSLLGAWQVRNYYCCGKKDFATVGAANFSKNYFLKCVKNEKDFTFQALAAVKTGSSCLLSVMTTPGSLKYFRNKRVTQIGKVIFYPWTGFWLIGFLAGCFCLKRDVRYLFLFFIILYFVGVPILNVGPLAGERFRIPVVPAIAILSAYGWLIISIWTRKIKDIKR